MWTVLWLVSGQGCFIFMVMVMEVGKTIGLFGEESGWLVACVVMSASISYCTVVTCAIGGLVVVGQMIQQDRLCIRV